jgi:hypothetical protein
MCMHKCANNPLIGYLFIRFSADRHIARVHGDYDYLT